MNKLIMPGTIYNQAQNHLFQEYGEHFIFFFCSIIESENGLTFLVRDIELIRDEDVISPDFSLEIKLSRLIEVMNKANRQGLALVEGHNHPRLFGSGFSSTDRRGYAEFVPYVLDVLGLPYGATIWDSKEITAMFWTPDGVQSPIDLIRILSDKIMTHYSINSREVSKPNVRESRQIMALGKKGQSIIKNLRVGVVGLGGLGSQIAQQLAYLGIRDFVLIDPDVVNEENLNRIVGSSPIDLGVKKVNVSERMIKDIAGNEALKIEFIADDLRNKRAITCLTQCDMIFGCVDRDGPRLILNELACTFLVPYIDAAFEIFTEDREITQAGGRTVLVMPESPCLMCCKEIDMNEARFDLANQVEREFSEERGYVSGAEISAPSVISLDGMMASLAVTEFLALFTNFRAPIQNVYYDMLSHKLIHIQNRRLETCLHTLFQKNDNESIFRYCV